MEINKIKTHKYEFKCTEEEMDMLINLCNKNHPRNMNEDAFAERLENSFEQMTHQDLIFIEI